MSGLWYGLNSLLLQKALKKRSIINTKKEKNQKDEKLNKNAEDNLKFIIYNYLNAKGQNSSNV